MVMKSAKLTIIAVKRETDEFRVNKGVKHENALSVKDKQRQAKNKRSIAGDIVILPKRR